MNRAALAARLFLGAVLLPIAGAAGWATYEYRIQPSAPPPDSQRMYLGTRQLSSQLLPNGFLLGTYAGLEPTGLTGFDTAVGTKVSLTIRYMHWERNFPAYYVNKAAKAGAKTIIELQPRGPLKKTITMAQIAAGDGDKWLKSFAQEIVSVREPFILSFGPEMNGNWYQYGHKYVTGHVYVSAYRHVHDVLVKDINERINKLQLQSQLPGGAKSLVSFMWQPSAMHRTTSSPVKYWPGSKFVDIVGLDGYYYYQNDTFAGVFGKTLTLVRSLTTAPVMIGETGAGPVYNRQVWEINDLFAGISRDHLLGLIWFDKNQEGKYPPKLQHFHQDWRLQDNPAALRAFQKEIASEGSLASFMTGTTNG